MSGTGSGERGGGDFIESSTESRVEIFQIMGRIIRISRFYSNSIRENIRFNAFDIYLPLKIPVHASENFMR